MIWRSIDEDLPELTVHVRGEIVALPRSYDRLFSRSAKLSITLVATLLQRLVSWGFALTLHLSAAVILMLLYFAAVPEEDPLVSLSLHRGNAGEEGKIPETPKFEDPKLPEPEPPPLPEPAPEKPAPVKPPEPAPAPEPPVEPKPATVGGGATAAPQPAAPVATAAPVSEKEIEADPTQALKVRRAGEIAQLRRGSARDIVVVRGLYDQVEAVLSKLGVPYTLIDSEDLPAHDLSATRVLLINCNRFQPAGRAADLASLERSIASLEKQNDDLQRQFDKTTDKKALPRLKLRLLDVTSQLATARKSLESLLFAGRVTARIGAFVAAGGYLFTSDWGLWLLESSFPGWVKSGGLIGPTTVKVRPRPGQEKHDLLREVFPDPAVAALRKFQWEVDTNSYVLRVVNGTVEVLMDSPQIPRDPAVTVAFSPSGAGGGKVLHVLSHFQRQATRQGDYALQNLLLNFILERVRKP